MEKSSIWQDGQNHLIFSVFPSSEMDPSLGKSMRAAAGLSDLDYRPGFDISLPAYSIHQEKPQIRNLNRQWFAVMPQIHDIKPKLRAVIDELSRDANLGVMSLSHCQKDNNERCDVDGNIISYPDILSDSTFCIILDTEFDSGQTISESLHNGCIPVILSGSTVLPFSEVIDWKRFSIRFHEDDIKSLYDTLSNVSQNRINEMRQQIDFVYNKYFATWKTIINTTLAILNDRIVPHHAKNYKHWNIPATVHESNPLFLRYYILMTKHLFLVEIKCHINFYKSKH